MVLLIALTCAHQAFSSESERPIFVERTAEAGLDFHHFNGMSGRFYFPEVVGAGGALFDFDDDGDLDLYLVQGRMLGPDRDLPKALIPPRHPLPLKDRLYRNDLAVHADGTRTLKLIDVTEASGIEGTAYGMGAATGDYDNDGRTDLYVTQFGAPNQLWRNRGDGTFSDATASAGVGEPRWSVPAVFLDFDRDGWLDLFVGNYVDYTLARNKPCVGESGLRDYCGPQSYEALPDRLYRNRGVGADGHVTFEDVSAKSGIAAEFGATLGVTAADFDGDGWLDVYVANDMSANQLWLNRRNGADGTVTFANDALLLGCALNRDGQAEASMGVDAADVDADGDLDLFMTHLTRESNTLYLNDGSGLFRDQSVSSGLGNPSWGYTGFGTAFFDYDNDGWLDVFVANGAVYLIFELAREDDPYPLHQTNQLFRNLGRATKGDGGVAFAEVTADAGEAFTLSEVSRGALFGDLDNDGDTDVVVANNSGPARLLINRAGNRAHWLGLRLVGTAGRDMLGARVAVHRQGWPVLWRRVRTDGSFASANDSRVLVGLGESAEVSKVDVFWPDGKVEVWEDLAVDAYRVLVQGTGKTMESARP